MGGAVGIDPAVAGGEEQTHFPICYEDRYGTRRSLSHSHLNVNIRNIMAGMREGFCEDNSNLEVAGTGARLKLSK